MCIIPVKICVRNEEVIDLMGEEIAVPVPDHIIQRIPKSLTDIDLSGMFVLSETKIPWHKKTLVQ